MNEHSAHDGEQLPMAKTRRRKWGRLWVWLVPVTAAGVAAFLVYQRVHESGPTITIRFRDVDGIRPGQTPLQYHGGDMGQVVSLALDADRQHTTVKVKLRGDAAPLARAGSVFWIVRPQFATGELTGLGTLITGPYIDVLPGNGAATNHFAGVEQSPRVYDPQGLRIVLLAYEAGSLRAGVPIYYRGIEVGSVEKTELGTNATEVLIRCVIRQRYATLVRAESKFWNVAGLDVRLSLFHGAEVNVESLKSLLIGGIEFATPNDASAEPVKDGTFFQLYAKAEKDWAKWSPSIPLAPENESDTGQDRQNSEPNLPGGEKSSAKGKPR